jgi:Sulfotransferase domain
MLSGPTVYGKAGRWRPTFGYVARLARNRLTRLQHEGIRKVARADLRRARSATRRARWAVRHDFRPNAVPVFIVGVQRSGTDMLIQAFKESAEVTVYNESADSPAFRTFKLRGDDVVRALVARSRHRCVVFKSLLDSHRTVYLLTELGTPSRGRAIWAYRSMAGRVRSLLAQWPDSNRRSLREIAAGEDRWERAGLSESQLALVRAFDYERMTPESGAALHWYLRNCLFFDLGLHERPDVALVSYERMIDEPARFLEMLCNFVGIAYDARMGRGIGRRPDPIGRALEIDPRIRELCDELESRLDAAFESRVIAGSLARGPRESASSALLSH